MVQQVSDPGRDDLLKDRVPVLRQAVAERCCPIGVACPAGIEVVREVEKLPEQIEIGVSGRVVGDRVQHRGVSYALATKASGARRSVQHWVRALLARFDKVAQFGGVYRFERIVQMPCRAPANELLVTEPEAPPPFVEQGHYSLGVLEPRLVQPTPRRERSRFPRGAYEWVYGAVSASSLG